MIASEVIDDGVHITTIHMPLVRTPMIAPTRMYDVFPAITPEEAAEMIAGAMVGQPKKVATRLGTFGELLYAVAPKASDTILNTAYKLFPESQAAKGKGEEAPDKAPTTEAVARTRRRALVARAAPSRTSSPLDVRCAAAPGVAMLAPATSGGAEALGLGVRGPGALASGAEEAAAGIRERLGFGGEVEEPVPLEEVELRAPRLKAPAALGDLFTRRASRAGRRTRWARPTGTWCAGSGASSRTRPTWWRCPATSRRSRRC